jgi:hypothetical protein
VAVRHIGHSYQHRCSPLGIYLNDHLTGATAGTELARRMAAQPSAPGAELQRMAEEITEDRSSLIDMMSSLGVPAHSYKTYLGWIAEKAGRLKPNGRLVSRSPLSSLEELEMLALAVTGKAAGWRTLRVLADTDDRLNPARLDALIARAREQADLLEELRRQAADRLVRTEEAR